MLFNKEEVQSKARPDGKKYTCRTCGLSTQVITPSMKPHGDFYKKIMIIGESPCEMDDKKGLPWQSRVGYFLRQTMKTLGVDLEGDCMSFHAVHCRTKDHDGQDREPTSIEVSSCRTTTMGWIQRHHPDLVILMGFRAVESIYGHRWKKDFGNIHKWRGWTIPDQELGCWVCPVFHPEYVLNAKDQPEITEIWLMDLKQALATLEKPFPRITHPEQRVQIIEKEREVVQFLKSLRHVPEFVFDIETSGLKPHDKDNHQIFTISFCFSDEQATVIPLIQSPIQSSILRHVMVDKSIGKIAHNLKFEHTWFKNIYDIDIEGWKWDTMQARHVLDNRPGIVSLKFQTAVQLGILDYASEVDDYLKGDAKNGNSVNNLGKAMKSLPMRNKIYVYCGLDSLFTWKLYKIQQNLLK